MGRVVAVMNGLGSFIAFFQTPAGMFVLIAAAAAVWGATALGSYLIGRRAAKKGTAAEHASGADGADGAGAETEKGAPAEAQPADETGETDKE